MNDPVGDMQLQVTEAALAHAATQSVLALADGTKVDTDETETVGMVVDELIETDGVPVGHIVKKRAVEDGTEGSRVGIPNRIDDHASTVIADQAKSTVEDHVGRSEIGRDPVTESQTKKIAEDHSARILHQMNLLFESMQSMGTKMDLRVGQVENRVQEDVAKEGRLRIPEYENLEKKMSAKMEEGERKMTTKTEEGFKNEEIARQVIQKELAVEKDELKNVKMGSGSTLCSEASTGIGIGSGTFARPPPLTSRWSEIFHSEEDGM